MCIRDSINAEYGEPNSTHMCHTCSSPSYCKLVADARLLRVPESRISACSDIQELKKAMKEVDIAKVAREYGVPSAEIKLAYDKQDLMELMRVYGAMTPELLEDAKMLGIPEQQIATMRTNADLNNAIRKVDLRAAARQKGVSEAQVKMAFDREDLIDIIRLEVARVKGETKVCTHCGHCGHCAAAL
eukprot:TRINITY_DN272_c0_g1_i5.p1 TRINITY_DN272_c0_g1~~TRINITY_DN272_c0_g1_i5.p1  ORF type:complete len:187 (-),score=54.97 TRINITY_DN272_c0_g1_i5:252-812(-)